MNTLLKIYLALPKDCKFGIISKTINRLVAKIVKRILDRTVQSFFLKTQAQYLNGLNTERRDKQVIVSLTSFPARIQDVWIVVECLFRQTYKADKIILWLDQNRFDITTLPINLKNQIYRGLEIRFVEDLRSHTKYYYALGEFKDAKVITVDDDCYYPESIIENLIKISKEFPNSIASNRVHKITFDGKKIKPYAKWHHNFNPNQSINGKYLLTGVSGVLYPPGIFDDRLFDKNTFLEKCKYADDVWLSINAFRIGLNVASNNTFNKDLISISKTWNTRLLNHNSKENGNDQQLRAVLDHFQLGNLGKFKEQN